MIHPVDYEPSQDFGENPTRNLPPTHPVIQTFGNYQPDGHSGEDYPCDIGTPVRAVSAGTVLHVGYMGGTYADNPWWIAPGFSGYCAVIDHGSFIGIYGHCQDGSAKVSKGQRVSEGQVFILSGNTGGSTGPHLHFEILPDGYILNSAFYGRINPASLFGGISPLGTTITPLSEEDDDMAFTDAQMVGFAKAGFDAWAKEQREFPNGRNLIDHLIQTRADVGVTAEAVRAIPAAILYNERVDGRNLFDWAKHNVAVASSIKPGTVNVDELAAALAEQLGARDLEALAKKLQITVKEN